MTTYVDPAIDRRTYLGGSDAAAILGLSPYDTPLDLYLYKIGEKSKEFSTQQMRAIKRGIREEPRIVDDIIEDGVVVVKRSTRSAPNRYQDAMEPYLAAEIDFEWKVTPQIADRFNLPDDVVGTIQNGEVKTVHPFAAAKFGEAGTDEIPVEYAAQAMHGLMLTNRQFCMFAVRNGFDINYYFLWRDDEVIKGYLKQAVTFWTEHVMKRVPPEPRNLPDVIEMLKRKLASKTSATPEVLEWLQLLAKARADEKIAKDWQDDLKFKIGRALLGEESVQLDGDGKVRPTEKTVHGVHLIHAQGTPLLEIVMQNQRRIDTDKLRENFPEQAAECTYTANSLVFRAPKGKKK